MLAGFFMESSSQFYWAFVASHTCAFRTLRSDFEPWRHNGTEKHEGRALYSLWFFVFFMNLYCVNPPLSSFNSAILSLLPSKEGMVVLLRPLTLAHIPSLEGRPKIRLWFRKLGWVYLLNRIIKRTRVRRNESPIVALHPGPSSLFHISSYSFFTPFGIFLSN